MCTTELGEAAARESEFTARGVRMVALSIDSAEDHVAWIADIKAARGVSVNYPIIADPTRDIALMFGMLDEDLKAADGLPLTVRSVYVIGPDKKVKLVITYPPSVGRNFDEIIRAIDALQLGAVHPIATPVNWKKGEEVVILPHITEAEATSRFPAGFRTVELPSGRAYLRLTPDPSAAAAAASSSAAAAEGK